MAETKTVVHLMRHGEVYNPDGILYGRLPGFRLSDLGQKMAERVADHLADHDIKAVVASPLQRAQETAAPIAARHDLEVRTDERLIEAGDFFPGQKVSGGGRGPQRPGGGGKAGDPVQPGRGAAVNERAGRK